MFGEKFIEFCDNLIKCSQLIKEKNQKNKISNIINQDNDEDVINDYELNDKSKAYIEKHISNLIDTSIKKFLENNNNQKYSFYLKMIQNIYCDFSELTNYFSNFKSMKMILKLYFIIMRTYYYNNKKLETIFSKKETFVLFIDYFFKEIILYAIKIFPNIDIKNKNGILQLNIENKIINSFIGESLPFIKNDTEEINKNNNIISINNTEKIMLQLPMNILYNITDYRHDIMKDIESNGFLMKKYFEKQENSLKIIDCYNEKNKDNVHLGVIIYFLNEIKEKYFVDRFIKYLEIIESDKKLILSKITTK